MTQPAKIGRLPIAKDAGWAKLQDAWSSCIKCPLSKLRTNVVFGHGNLNARLMMIGEAPGEQEDLTGEPFVGPAGERFNALLEAVGIDRSDLWVTNTCLCRPKSNKKGKQNRAPTVEEIRSCFPRLAEEINIVRPEILVLAGNTPLFMATHKRGITKLRGWQESRWNGNGFTISHVYATLHPASLLYGSAEQRVQKAHWMYNDWLEIARILGVKSKNEEDTPGT